VKIRPYIIKKARLNGLFIFAYFQISQADQSTIINIFTVIYIMTI